ncbi:serine hydrolase domain-containing protein [Oryzicola mucosus]|nr:serine hydrolase [Oryzicola mucosus]
MRKFLKALLLSVLLLIVAAGIWLAMAPPATIKIAAGYSAKIVCSNVFLAGRDAEEVLRVDVQAPGHPVLRLMSVQVDHDARIVTAALLGLFGKGVAVYREGLGCTTVPEGNMDRLAAAQPGPAKPPAVSDATWPQGSRVDTANDPAVRALLDDEAMAGPGMRAIVVVHDGRIVGERYAEGFGVDTPLLGWSMTKTVTAAIIGTLVDAGRMNVSRSGLFQEWQGDARSTIKVSDLMGMSSGLEFNEDYGDVTDVTRMLYLEPDMAGFAASKPLAGGVGEVFSYSSGTTLLLSRLWQEAVGERQAAVDWPRKTLFDPIGMASAVMEPDASGTYVGSSYLYATARDWARFGQLLLQDGSWSGQQILPPGFVEWMRQPAPASQGTYGYGQLSLSGPGEATRRGNTSDNGFDLPTDTYWLLGHDGQSIAIAPSARLVVVRLGLTPSRLGYKPQALFGALAKAMK